MSKLLDNIREVRLRQKIPLLEESSSFNASVYMEPVDLYFAQASIYELGFECRARVPVKDGEKTAPHLDAMKMYLCKEIYGETWDTLDEIIPLLYDLRHRSRDREVWNIAEKIGLKIDRIKKDTRP